MDDTTKSSAVVNRIDEAMLDLSLKDVCAASWEGGICGNRRDWHTSWQFDIENEFMSDQDSWWKDYKEEYPNADFLELHYFMSVYDILWELLAGIVDIIEADEFSGLD